MLKCTNSAAGGISHLLKPGPAVILSVDKNPLMTAPFFVSIPDVSVIADVTLMLCGCQPAAVLGKTSRRR
jgi:hypothetical protein